MVAKKRARVFRASFVMRVAFAVGNAVGIAVGNVVGNAVGAALIITDLQDD